MKPERPRPSRGAAIADGVPVLSKLFFPLHSQVVVVAISCTLRECFLTFWMHLPCTLWMGAGAYHFAEVMRGRWKIVDFHSFSNTVRKIVDFPMGFQYFSIAPPVHFAGGGRLSEQKGF